MSTIKKGLKGGTMDKETQGVLYMVATPIGNLEDITLRALRVLREVDLIAAEDTRRSGILLSRYEIKTPLISLHEHNEKERSRMVLSRLKEGLSVAYVSDAGTPCVSDPGHHLVSMALEKGVRVVPVPGACALPAALSVCGFDAAPFLFCGFLPPGQNQRRRFLESVSRAEYTIIFYESPARIRKTLEDARDILGDRQVVVARELTKVFEEIQQGRISDLLTGAFPAKIRGEFTVMVRAAAREPVSLSEEEIQETLLKICSEKTVSLRDAVAEAARRTGMPRKRIYDAAIKIRREFS